LARRFAVRGFDRRLVEGLEEFYAALAAAGGRYRFYCRRGRCWSVIEGGEAVEAVVSSTPGLVVEECRGPCREGGVLLPPPPRPAPPRPREAPRGPVVLGYSGGGEVGLASDALWGHVAVLGATGSGKSHSAARVVRCAAEALGVAGLVLDWHNEYHRLVPGARLLSGGSLPPVPLVSDALGADEALAALESVLGLSRNQSLLLSVLLSAAATGDREAAAALVARLLGPGEAADRVAGMLASARGLRDLMRAALEAYRARGPEAPRGEAEAWAALIRRLAMLALDGRYSRLFTMRGVADLPLSEGEVSLIDLSSILNPGVRRLYAMLLLEAVYASTQQGSAPATVAVVEEAHNFSDSATLPRLLGEARKYRLGVVVVTHTPRSLDHRVVANTNTLLVHRIVSAEDLRLLEELLPASTSYALPRLPSGMAVLHTPGAREPVLLAVEEPGAPC